MKKISKILSLVLAACMIFGMLPALSAGAADAEAGNFMEITSGNYLSTVGSNAFNVFMYDNTFSGTFGDQHMGGIEMSLNGMRIATNGDLHLLPTPEQWDATPAPSRGSITRDRNTNTITVPMTFSGATDGTLRYDLIASPTTKGMKLQMILRSDMPESLKGKARFNLELRPASYKNKSYQADLNGDGVYDSFGVFPLHPQDAMIETERVDLPSQQWYVKDWNEQRGDDQPAPFATAYGFSLSPEDETSAITFTSNTDDKMELLDGRNRAQNGWYVLSTVISATKSGETAIEWIVEPKVKQGWVREPNVGFSQVGYTPAQEKFAVVELDKWDNDYPKEMSLYRVNADGSEEEVCKKTLGSTTDWMRFKYARFDFSEVTEAGLYRIHYGDYVGEIFPIAKTVYDRVWHTTLSGFLAVQMDHIVVREGYKIWHGASHMDDGVIGDRNSSWFDGMSMQTMPNAIRQKGYKGEDHVEGLNKGGWFDAGDFDLQISRNVGVLGNLVNVGEICGRADNYDDLYVEWDDETGGLVEMHRPDGIPDIVQQCIHGSKQLLAEYECLGGTGGTMEVRYLRQYTHLGDPSSDTDGWIYDSSLKEGEVVERDGKVYSGVSDDRYFLTAGGGGSFSAGLSQGIVNSFAGTAYMAVDYPATREYAQHLFNTCIDRWKASNWSSNWDTVVQFALASDAFEKNGVAYDDQETLSAAYFRGLLDALIPNNLNANSHINVLALKHMLTEEQWAQVGQSVQNVNVSVNNQPYGVNFTSGSGWGASPNTYGGVRNISYMYYHFPLKKFEQNILRSVNYLMGRHPATNSSWISGVGTKSMLHPYNSNRAEESYIPGSILPGHITFNDYVESMDDFNFLWFENESIINYQAEWLPVGIAAGHIAHNEEDPTPAATKDFESDFSAELIEKTSTSMWGGGGTSNYYFSDDGFNMIMYATTFDRTFGDQHCAGIELIQDGRRIATNGDIHLLPTPEQWDATPPPTKGTVTAEGNTVTVPMTIPAETFDDGTPENPAVPYQLIAEPEKGGIKLTVKLDAPLPADLVGKAGFNMEFLPAVFIGKSYQSDSDGDGKYDDFGVFPKDPRDQMEEVSRARTNNQAWYVQEWNEQRGDAQPVPFSTGKKMTFAAETDDYRIRIASDDGLALYDGRNRAQNGWFVLRTLIPAGKTEIVWHISPDTDNGWTREPNITHSQVGYEPELSKVAVIELDPNYKGSDSAKLLKLEADGSYTEVFSKALGEAKSWQRYVYRDFDFSEVKARGTYVIDYDGFKSDPFPIDKHVYKDIYTESIGNYMAVQMDHMRIREGYKIWRNAAHMDDALQAPVGVSYFDGQSMGASSDSPYEAYEHIPGLDVGGFSDAGDFDIQVAQNLSVINSLALAYQVFGNRYDTLDVNWETKNVELHRSDDVPDLIQLAKHGALNILAQIDAVGFTASVIEVPTLRQYTHLGDGSKDTDNRIYDPSLAEDETVGRRSGKRDDRLAFFQTKSTSNVLNAATAIAASASILPDSDPDKARMLAAAEKIWNDEPDSHVGTEGGGGWFSSGPADWNLALELFYATGKEVYKNRILECLDTQLVTSGSGWFGPAFASAGYKVVKVLDKLGDEAKAKFEAALDAYAPSIGQPNASNPYGVSDTMGMWGGSGGVVSGAIMASILHKYYPEKVSTDSVFRAINYILGTHPYNSTSWISGVGANSLQKGYGSNRADFYYIAGGLAPGYVTIAPDFPEALDDFNFLWFENEYTVEVTANWILLTLGADEFARESDVPCEHDWQSKVTEPTCTKGGYTTRFCSKCFESETVDYTDPLGHDFDNGVVTKQPTAMFDGVKTFTCQRCGATYKESIPKLPSGNTNNVSIDFTKAADAGKYEIRGQETAEVVEGEGVTLVSLMGGPEPAKRSIEERERDLVSVPLNDDWMSATLRFDFDAKGAGGAWAFFGFFAAEGEGYQNMLGIRGGDGAMQNFERHDGTITHEDESGVNSTPGLSRTGEYILQIARSGDTYTCYRSDDGGENFEEMFTYEASGINADKLVIDAYSGRDEGYTFVLKSLDIEYPGGGAESKIIDFKNPADNEKYEIVNETSAAQGEDGLALVTTTSAFEDCKGQLSGDQATTPVDLVAVPVSGDWTATLQVNFDSNGARNGYYQFFGFYAAEGDDYQNVLGVRGGDGAMQNFERHDGTITHQDEDGVNSTPGFAENGTYWFQIVKDGDTYTCFRSADGETFDEMFAYDASGIEADRLLIDAYTGLTEGYKYTLDTLIIEGVGGEGPAEWKLATSIEPGKQYVIVADGAYAMTNEDVPGKATYAGFDVTRGAEPVTIADGKITSGVTDNMVWTIETDDGAPAYDGLAQYNLIDCEGKYLRRGSMSQRNAALVLDEDKTATARYYTWSFAPYEDLDATYAMYVNSERAYGNDYPGRVAGNEAGFDIPGTLDQRSEDDPFAFMNDGVCSKITLYTLTSGSVTPQPAAKPEVSGITVGGEALAGFDAKVKDYSVAVDGNRAPTVAATAGNSDTRIKVTQASGVPGQAVIEATSGSGSLTYTVSFDRGPRDDYFADGTFADFWTILNEVKEPTEEEPFKYYRVDKGVGLVMPTQHNSIYQKATPGAWSNMFTQPAAGDWEVVAKAFYPAVPDGNYQQVQFIAWQDEDNYVRINCQDNRRRTEPFYERAGTAVNQNANAVNNAISVAEDGSMTMYFKINKAGNTYTLSYSEDGLDWKSGGVYEAALTNVKVAVFCTQDYQPTQSNYKEPVELAFEYVAVTSRDGKAVRSDAETLTWAAQNAANYIAAGLPSQTSDMFAISAAPHGYSVKLTSSDPDVISEAGFVTPAAETKNVQVTVTVSEGETSASATKTIVVPGTGGSTDNPITGSTYKVTAPHAVKLNANKADEGNTIIVTADDTIEKIAVKTVDGTDVAVQKLGNTYKFNMPAADVQVKTYYAKTAIAPLQSVRQQGNPFIPIYDFNPDTEPHIWEDPDNPGQYRFYFLSSHDMNKTSYCSNNHVLYSCPVDDPFNWTYHGVIVGPDNTEHNDTLYAPDMCCVEDPTSPTGKYYYYYPCNQAGGRQTMVLRSSRPDGKGDPFTVINWADDSHNRTLGSIMTFDPSVFVDDDGKVYGYWGGYNSSSHGAQLDETMYNAVPGTQVDDMFEGDGVRGSRFGFFEASSMRKIGDTYVFVYSSSGKSGDPYSGDYHHLAYAYGKNPLGPWTYGGVIVDAQAYGFYGGGNTHGSLIQLGDQWYITYHRNVETDARQAMVSPVDVTIDENGAVKITEAEVSSEGFYINGLNPYAKVSLGTASYARNCRIRPLYEHDVESLPIINVVQNTVVGVTYFDFNTEAPEGTTSSLNVDLIPNGVNATMNIWVQSANVPDSQKRTFNTANATKIGEIKITADMPKEMTTLSVDTPDVDKLDGKYGVFYTFSDVSGSGNIAELYDMQFEFSDHEHDYDETVVAPGCLEGGYTVGKCKICGKEVKYDYTDALGHDWDEGKVTVPATETAPGVMTYTCKRCGETKTARIPRIGSTVPDDIDFKLTADKDKYEIVNQSQSDCVEGEGVALIATTQAFEDCKTQLSGDQATTPVDVVKVPVEGDWAATLEVDFNTNGASNGYYQFFGFYASQGDDYQNLAGIRGGDGAMQNFERHDGTITHQDEDGVNSTPGFASIGTYFLRIEKVGDDYTCFRSEDGETFTEMFSYPDSGIDADYIIIDAYTGMTQNYKFTLKTLKFEDVGGVIPEKPDTTALQAAIAAAEAVDTGLYTDASVAALQTALAAAKEALKADKQADVDAAKAALDSAVAALELKPEPVNYDALNAAIADAEKVDKSKYTDETVAAFETALAAAKAAQTADNQAAVDKAKADLDAAKAALVEKPEPVNYDALNAAIAEAEKVDKSKYTDETVAAFEAALAAAKAAKTADNQAAVNKAKEDLEAAKAALVEKPIEVPVNYDALNAAIEAAEKVDGSKYTPASGEALAKALEAAKAAKTADTQAAVDAAKDALLKAIDDLELKPVEPFRFDDVKDPSQYYFDPVYWAYEHEPQITKGTSDTLFSPNAGCTRAQVVTFLWRAAGEPKPTKTENPFVDVKEGQYYYDAVLWAVEKGITTGTTATTFRPNQTCTRGQIVTFLWRYSGQPKPKTTENPFEDVKAGEYYYDAVLWAVENKITTGTSATTFRPNNTCTRAQIVTFLYRAMAEEEAAD